MFECISYLKLTVPQQPTKKEEIIISSLNLPEERFVSMQQKQNENKIALNEIVAINVKDKEFELLMNIYKKASDEVLNLLNGIKNEYEKMYEHSIINHITNRLKSEQSIINKMKKKNLEMNYMTLVDNINDIAGIRVISSTKDDVYTMVKIIEKIPNWRIIKAKDYIKKPKKSGYSGYHIIVAVPVIIHENGKEKQIHVKVEIQLRTMAMDFWATNEHKMKYKTNKKLSFFDSTKLALDSRILNMLDHGFSRIARKK